MIELIVFTSVCANYIHKARTLAMSVKANIRDAKMVLCLVERELDPRIKKDVFDDIILAKDAWEGNFNRFIFKHTIVEASTSVKGQFFRFLMDKYRDEENFVYLDPDVYVYGDFKELQEALEKYPIVLCPHLLQPGNIDMELSSTAHGVYNLGFLAIHRSEEGRKCIDWWAQRLYLYCYDDIARGIFTDQKWMDLAPCFFNVHIFKHHGYDFAPWSLLNSEICYTDGEYYVNGDPLRFIHFSGLGATAEKCMREWLPENETVFHKLYNEYVEAHNINDRDMVSKTTWSYSNYYSGEEILPEIRHRYRSNYDVMFSIEDPFSKSNDYFKHAIVKKGLGSKTKALLFTVKTLYKTKGIKGVIIKVKDKLKK